MNSLLKWSNERKRVWKCERSNYHETLMWWIRFVEKFVRFFVLLFAASSPVMFVDALASYELANRMMMRTIGGNGSSRCRRVQIQVIKYANETGVAANRTARIGATATWTATCAAWVFLFGQVLFVLLLCLRHILKLLGRFELNSEKKE